MRKVGIITRRVILEPPGQVYPHLASASSLRVGPMRNEQPIASWWRFWASGNDVYVANRNAGNHTRVSLHASGIWFCALGHRRHTLMPPFPLPGGDWLHALELAFLIPEHSLPLPEQRPLKPSQKAHTIETPLEHKLTLNLLYGAAETRHSTPLPSMMQGHTLMQTRLARGTPIVVVARLHPYSDQDRQTLDFHRNKLGLRVQSEKPVENPALELAVVSTQPGWGGNVITVIGMGREAFTTTAQRQP